MTGKKLPLSSFVTDPTIEQQALLLKNDGWKPSWKSLVPLKPGGSKVPFFLRASGIWFGYTFSGDDTIHSG
ncbi:MAG: hypothetical protein R2942_02875 [Ignavibacteria bacterium]